MSVQDIEFNPWLRLFAARRKRQRNMRHQNIRTATSVRKRIITERQRFLGSNFPLKGLLHIDGEPWEDAIEELASYLSNMAYKIMCREHGSGGNGSWCADWYDGFFRYTTLWLAHDGTGCLDDYIKLAETFENTPNAIRIIFSENLPPDKAVEAEKWVVHNESAPLFLTECVTGAVACLTGAMVEPKEMEDRNYE